MIKTGIFFASALIAIGTLSTPSFAQSLSQYDIEQQRLNDVRQQTSDSGLNTINHPLDRVPLASVNGYSVNDRQMQGLARKHFDNTANR
jgi:hypothetical protein